MSISVVILAAGQGTRMKSSMPKVLHKISGKSMLFHAIEAAQKLSNDITVVLYHQADMIKAQIEAKYENINFHIQDAINFPGTGGAMRGVITKNDKTLILNGDMPLVTDEALHKLIGSQADITMSVIMLDNPSGYGRVIIENNSVLEIVEQKDCDQKQLCTKSVNAGVYCVSSKLLNRYIPKLSNANSQKEYYLTDIIKMGVEENITIEPIYVDEEEFKGVNSKIDLAHAEQIHQTRIKNNFMANGVIMRLPDTIYIESDVEIEGECIIENGVSLIGNTKIINSHIKSNSVVEDSTLKDSDVGPMARIRPQSILSGTHIGNFVEVKKGILDGVKAGHLSYLGDCTIGSGSNIGAGTITCNYDGKAKYQTIIGKNVFVGSDTQLVAPINIPDDVMIAAGTTVTKDPVSGDLVLSRTPQKSIARFFYKFFGK